MGDYIGYCCWKKSKKGSTLHICNSEDPGAFKIYRHQYKLTPRLLDSELDKHAQDIVDQIYTDGSGKKINRLVAEYGEIKGGTGWGQVGIKHLVHTYLKKHFQSPPHTASEERGLNEKGW